MQPFFVYNYTIMKRTTIITAGGIGKRMQSDLPKQFLLLDEKPILAHCLQRFHDFDQTMQLIVSLPKEWKSYWQHWCEENGFTIKHELVEGGEERYHSIKNALSVANGDVIAIHDGVRPLLSLRIIRDSFQIASESGTAIPVLALKESVRYVDKLESKALNRKKYFIVQTPQVFQKEIITKAYEIPFHDQITDDASLVEETGVKLSLFEGDEQNIKITTPLDLKIASLVLEEVEF